MIEIKKCRVCGITKPNTPEYFYLNKGKLLNTCIECRKEWKPQTFVPVEVEGLPVQMVQPLTVRNGQTLFIGYHIDKLKAKPICYIEASGMPDEFKGLVKLPEVFVSAAIYNNWKESLPTLDEVLAVAP
ncbi:MAG: hypothetical protein HXX08_11590 [Chloroflexi bacterium]|uniref:Uncharacterized protein n=1 Tax=Candidatus Chlorohelix allophototropha TaxID=3003348 RepID=A0A8T7LZI4_9CHLR|nr:hypothetical protein [Chloroflexota bacterium]WJW65882.1 hypothetical protein OZ401_001661 [Chloroflexota bacterium L227-S17]